MGERIPRLVIAGLSGDSGKTIVSLSLITALYKQGRVVSAFKKGPDYIDSAWLGFSANSVCRNLDTWLVPKSDVSKSFIRYARVSEVAIIEGNRGLFDGKDVQGSHSSAELAKLLQAPVVLVVDATKMTRTVVAVINGCQSFDTDVHIAGVILNRVAGKRHERILRDSIATYCNIPILGCLPKLDKDDSLIPGRHLGLVPPAEHEGSDELSSRLLEIANQYLDLPKLLEIASSAPELDIPLDTTEKPVSPKVKIGYFHDSVFTFYYPENLEALVAAGAELMPISSLNDTKLPDINALYIGGGFPETQISRLIENRSLMQSVRKAAKAGLPIYAECGGLIYLCRSLAWQGDIYPMAGVFDIELKLSPHPIGHGYTEMLVDENNPYFEKSSIIKGHEFHYSGPVSLLDESYGCMKVKKGVGLGNGRDGLVTGNTMASYMHIHAGGVKEWAQAFVNCAVECQEKNSRDTALIKSTESKNYTVRVQPAG